MAASLQDLLQLRQVMAASYESAQAILASLTRHENDIKKQLEGLLGDRAASATRERTAADPATIAGADLRWNRWIDQRRVQLNNELAQIRARKSDAQSTLHKAFGRHEAVRLMQVRATEESRQLRSRAMD